MSVIVYFDLETGGLSPLHPDIQIAAIAVGGWQEIESYEAKIRFDEKQAEPEALALNSYDPEAWEKDGKPEAQVVAEFGGFLRRHAAVDLISQRGKPYSVARLAGHNAVSFDAPRLRRMFERHSAFCPATVYQPLDTVQLALWRCAPRGETPPSFKLVDLCSHFGVDLDDAHDALSDVRATISLARRLMED